MCDPSPGTSPNARTRDAAERLVCLTRASSRRPFAWLASASMQRTGDSSTPSKSSSDRLSRVALDRAICNTWLAHLTQVRAGSLASAPQAIARRRLARAGAFQNVSHIGVAVLSASRRDRRGPGPADDLRNLGVDRPGIHPLHPVLVVAVHDPHRHRAPERRPWRTPAVTSAVSFSIFIRPPRPCPSWRRAMSRLRSSGEQLEACGQPLDDRGQSRVRAIPLQSLSGCEPRA